MQLPHLAYTTKLMLCEVLNSFHPNNPFMQHKKLFIIIIALPMFTDADNGNSPLTFAVLCVAKYQSGDYRVE